MDDYSRYLLVCERFDHDPTTDELTELLENLPRKPEKILTDNGNQFKLRWERWCRDNAKWNYDASRDEHYYGYALHLVVDAAT